MKKLLTFLFVLFIASFSQAQWVVESFDNAVGPVYLDPPVKNVNFFASGTNPVMNLYNEPDHFGGTGSMKIEYTVEASEGWGGYTVRRTYASADEAAGFPDIDLSAGTHLKLRYKVISPPDTTKAGAVFMELKPYEVDEAGVSELWNHHMQIDMFDISGEWKEVLLPLVKNSDNNLGFSRQSGSGDNEIQWHNIKAFELTCVYIVAGNATNPPTASGVILVDEMELVGNRYNPFQTFDNAASGVFSIDAMDWEGDPSKRGSLTLTNNASDFVEGTGSMQLDYVVNASETWGGYVNIVDTTFVPDSNFNERTSLIFYVKNANPLTGTTPKRVTMRFILLENSTGTGEENWTCEVPINFEEAGGWTRYVLPLKMDTVWTDGNGHKHFPQNGFAQFWWDIKGDNILNLEAVTKYKIELSAGDDTYGPLGEKFTGTLLFDVIQQSGFQFADKTAPEAPVLTVVPFAYSNAVTWLDVPGETAETYYLYSSTSPITDVTAPGVEPLYTVSPIPEGKQFYDHKIYSANTDKPRTYYYAITCKDFAGNVSPVGTFGPVTNTAKGIPTVSINPPSNFVADGILSEWSDAQPSFLMQSALGTANVPPPPQVVSSDADCSAEVKVAVDDTYLYVMMDVTDDLVFWVDDVSTWMNDAADVYIGFYNLTEIHRGYWRGEKPDYHIRFGKFKLRNDGGGAECDSVLANGNTDIVPVGGSENYYWGEKFPSGYIVEARIPLVDLATKRNGPTQATDVISWKVGDRVPFDIGINDNDGNETDAGHPGVDREGMIFWSPTNMDYGWQYVDSWGYTWISDDVTAVDDNPAAVNTFNLAQNYPNPFNPSTQIQYSIAEAGLVSIKVFDILGRQVAELVNQNQGAGTYTVDFNAQNLSTGVYIYKIESGSFQASKKMILMK